MLEINDAIEIIEEIIESKIDYLENKCLGRIKDLIEDLSSSEQKEEIE